MDVDALRAGHDLLPAHEEVVGVCEGGVARGGVRVEGAEGARVLVDGVEVGFVLFEHDLAEGLLLCGAEARVSRMLPQSRRKRATRWTHGKVGGMVWQWGTYSMSECGSPASTPASDRSAFASANVMRIALSPGGNWKVPASG